MAKIVLELKNAPQQNDILVYNNGVWECKSKNLFLKEYNKQLAEVKEENESLKKELHDFKRDVNKRLKEYHDILQQLTKKEE